MKITVIGKGNAGVYTALHYKYYSPETEVELIYDDKVPSQTVGQASFPDAPGLLYNALLADWHKNPMKATLKTGILYQNWGKQKKEFLPIFLLLVFLKLFFSFSNHLVFQLTLYNKIRLNFLVFD
jgi:hypothetical protein